MHCKHMWLNSSDSHIWPMCRLESQAAENVALKQRAEGYRNEAGALESRLALIKAQRNKLLVAFEGLAGLHRH